MAAETVSQMEVEKDAFKTSEIKLWELHAMLQEAIAVVECRLQILDNEVAYGARDLLNACADRIRKATEDKSGDRVEDESARLGVALAVLFAANEEADDVVMWAAIRITKSAKEMLDELILNLPIEA